MASVISVEISLDNDELSVVDSKEKSWETSLEVDIEDIVKTLSDVVSDNGCIVVEKTRSVVFTSLDDVDDTLRDVVSCGFMVDVGDDSSETLLGTEDCSKVVVENSESVVTESLSVV